MGLYSFSSLYEPRSAMQSVRICEEVRCPAKLFRESGPLWCIVASPWRGRAEGVVWPGAGGGVVVLVAAAGLEDFFGGTTLEEPWWGRLWSLDCQIRRGIFSDFLWWCPRNWANFLLRVGQSGRMLRWWPFFGFLCV